MTQPGDAGGSLVRAGATPRERTATRVETLYITILAQVLLPLLPFLAELKKDHGLTEEFWKAWEGGSAIYILALAVACELRWARHTAIGAGLVAVAIYGFIPRVATPTDPIDVHDALDSILLVVLGVLLFTIDRAFYLLVKGKAG
jgi:hypothetical protein